MAASLTGTRSTCLHCTESMRTRPRPRQRAAGHRSTPADRQVSCAQPSASPRPAPRPRHRLSFYFPGFCQPICRLSCMPASRVFRRQHPVGARHNGLHPACVARFVLHWRCESFCIRPASPPGWRPSGFWVPASRRPPPAGLCPAMYHFHVSKWVLDGKRTMLCNKPADPPGWQPPGFSAPAPNLRPPR